MPAIESSEIKRPRKGQAVWMIVNGEPALRYFAGFRDQHACIVSHHADLRDPYYDTLAYFFRSEEAVLWQLFDGCVSRANAVAREMTKYLDRLDVIAKARQGKRGRR